MKRLRPALARGAASAGARDLVCGGQITLSASCQLTITEFAHKAGNGELTITCRNRHCPKCQGAAARQWLAEREAELLPVPYYHVVFTLPAQIADNAYQNKAVIYDLLFRASAETMLTIAADPEHLGARIGVLSVLHTWGSALIHHPHVHMIVPGGGISLDGKTWVSCRPGFFLPVRVLSRLFRRLFLEKLVAAHQAGELQFFGNHAALTDAQVFAAFLAPLRNIEWVVYTKRPFGGPKAVLAYLARYTHRVAISNRRLIAFDDKGVSFKWKDYRIEGRDRLLLHGVAERWADIAIGCGGEDFELLSHGRSRRLHVCDHGLTLRIARIDQDRKARVSVQELMQKPELLCPKPHIHGGDTRDVSARSIEADDEASLDRIGATRVYNRNSRGRGFSCESRGYAARPPCS